MVTDTQERKPLTLTVEQAAKEVGCGTKIIKRLIDSKRIPFIKDGRRYLISRVGLARTFAEMNPGDNGNGNK